MEITARFVWDKNMRLKHEVSSQHVSCGLIVNFGDLLQTLLKGALSLSGYRGVLKTLTSMMEFLLKLVTAFIYTAAFK